MFTEFLTQNKIKVEYYNELCAYIEKHASGERPLIAVHGFCTDGGVAGAMIHHQMPEAIIIPLDYNFLNDPLVENILANLYWYAIVDLKPFNNHPMQFWVDHHLSALDSTPNANQIRFDVDGDSGSYQLFLSGFIGELPEHLIELAIMTRTTDTAGYITSPPHEQFDSLSELVISETTGEEGRKQLEKRIWLLDDAWGTTQTLQDQLKLYDLLAKYGFKGLEKVLPRINKMRQGRKVAVDMAHSINQDVDMIIFIFTADSVDHFTITRTLQSLGAKIVISMAVQDNGVKLSLRRKRGLSEELNQKILLNKLAIKLNGGGHAGASGAFMDNIQNSLKIIISWAEEKGFSYSTTDFRS
ncbi:MAG: hypothetical protein INQ03_11685 [Candidatus Heimdallarchaeota archaeon]|nr:hypothetical protein [Candidatus Heimdallarchaeota archaeon]